jgi:hypothetical protein
MRFPWLISALVAVFLLGSPLACVNSRHGQTYDDLVRLFYDWREFERPPLNTGGVPDYSAATFNARQDDYKALRSRLDEFNIANWPREHQVDWYIILAEMNGYDFNYRVLKPWERDPAFYKTIWMSQSDVPGHEGPTHHAVLEVWQYEFPLNNEDQVKFLEQLRQAPAMMAQARVNLTGNARELWIAGIRPIRQQVNDLEMVRTMVADLGNNELNAAIDQAVAATNELVGWLEEEAENKTGTSGIGKENYTWYQQNVHLVPLTWEDEVMILKRELARAWSSLKLEEQRNRNLPQLVPAESPEEFEAMAQQSIDRMLTFLDQQEIVTVAPYFEKALQDHRMLYIPEEERNFFTIGAHYSPLPLYSHFYHWFELARMVHEPNKSEIRREALLYNIFDSRNEGTATAVEEMFMHAGLYDDNPRVREIVWIMIAQRAARGLGSLYAHANEMTVEEAGSIHSEYTPRGWMKTEKELLLFEQHLYARQPGYGTSYIVGKYLLEDTMAEVARLKELAGEDFSTRSFFDELNRIGNIPISLGRYQMTGMSDQLKYLQIIPQ